MRDLPSGTVTFLFTDIEGSTRLLQGLGGERYVQELRVHRERIRTAVAAHDGVEFGTEGDAFFVAFARASDALAAAEAAQAALAEGAVRVRMGIHTGEPLVVDEDYVGLDVHKAARICSVAHGGQVVVSQATYDNVGRPLRDLGHHRLKDLTAPERLFQLDAGDHPPLRTLRHTNLPVQSTPLVGRERDLAELERLAGSTRLLTLTGPGGVGKTRLALGLAAELEHRYRDGVWWVSLASVTDPALAIGELVQALGARGDLPGFLAGKELLVVLDNLEQVLDAASEIGQLLAATTDLHLVVTSRERLALAGEQEYQVEPLVGGAASELFTNRARQLKRGFEPDANVPEICRRLDGLPLALELAATRVKLMSTAAILTRLERRLELLTGGRRDLPARQATLRAAIDWSYDLLSDGEQRLFRSLGVFAGSFELEDAEAVCGAALDDLQSLVDKSLVRQTDAGRFFLLETIHEYARGRLQGSGEREELRRLHAARFLELGSRAAAGLKSADQAKWLARLRADGDNLRAVLAWAREHDVARGVELAHTLFQPLRMQGRLEELDRWLDQAIGAIEAGDEATRALALYTHGRVLFFTNRFTRAGAVLDEALELFRAIGDERGEASVLNMLGSVRRAEHERERASELRQEALRLARRVDDQALVARALHLLGEDLRDDGQLARAAETLEEAAAIDTKLGDLHSAMQSVHSLGDLALDAHDPGRAATWYRQALAMSDELGDEWSAAYCVAGLASAAALDGDAHSAGCLWGAAEAVEERFGTRFLDFERARYERVLASVSGDPGFRAGAHVGRELTLAQAVREQLA